MDSKLTVSKFSDLPFFIIDEEFARSRFLHDDLPTVREKVDDYLWDGSASRTSSILSNPSIVKKRKKSRFERPKKFERNRVVQEEPSKEDDEVGLLSSFMEESIDERVPEALQFEESEKDGVEIFRRIRRRDALVLERIRNSLRGIHPEMKFIVPQVETDEAEILNEAKNIDRKQVEKLELAGKIYEAEKMLLEDDRHEKFFREKVDQEDDLLEMIQNNDKKEKEKKRKKKRKKRRILENHQRDLDEQNQIDESESEEENNPNNSTLILDDENIDEDIRGGVRSLSFNIDDSMEDEEDEDEDEDDSDIDL